MEITCAYSALTTAISFGTELGFVVFLQILISFFRPDIVDRDDRVKPVSMQNTPKSYDFIIIGAGSAGSVLANRLTENAKWTVLLLEAGGDETVISDIPGLARILQKTDMDWGFKTEPSLNYCLGMNNNQCIWPRGKALGGTSTINLMMYIRGNQKDYNQWRDLGNPGWSYDDVLPYFKKSEDMTIPDLQTSPYHGTGGYLTVEPFRYYSPLTNYILNASREMGYNILDVNGETQTGFMATQGTMRDGLRCSTAKAFLRSASDRENLYVSTYSMVDKILVNETTKTAYGVQFRRDGKTYTAHARNEVILSAGALQSPQLLMLSGIGPKEHLEEIGIDVIHDSPGVGQNFQDHIAMGGLTFLINTTSKNVYSRGSTLVTLSSIDQFLNESSGPLYGVGVVEAVAFVNTIFANSTLDYPDIELVFTSGSDNAGHGFASKYYRGLRDDLFESLYGDILDNVTYSFTAILLRPKSRGHVKLRDADSNHLPLIEPNYFNNSHDLDVLIEGAKIVYNISQTPTMQMLNARFNPNVIPGCAQFEFFSDDYLRCHARHFSLTAYHPVGTCKMGPANDTMAVVDPRLRVYGVRALRVVDVSIMPNITSGNTNAPTIMIAEKTADLIKEDYGA